MSECLSQLVCPNKVTKNFQILHCALLQHNPRVFMRENNNNNRLTALYPGHEGEPAPELSETLMRYITFIVLQLITSTPNLPSQASQSTCIRT